MTSLSALLFGWLALLSIVSGCAVRPVKHEFTADELRQRACGKNEGVREVRGSLWMTAKSPDASGQFPAEIVVSPDLLRLEVTNLVGGREALITVQGNKYTIEHEGKLVKGKKSWSGIPLQWANALFLGKVPCPIGDTAKKGGDDKMSVNEKGELEIVTLENEKFLYRFRSWAGAPWPEAVSWETSIRGSKTQVDFEFQDPDEKSGAAKIWSAKSAQGEVKVRWKDRETR